MDIQIWDSNKSYKKFDIVKYNGHTFYSKRDLNDTTPIYTKVNDDPNETAWASENVFIFEPSYQTSVEVTPPNNELKMDDGYKKSSARGFNNTSKRLKFLFENRGDQESRAILNFLNEKGGEPFWVKLPFPYEKYFHFISLNWNHSFNYSDDNTVDITIEEIGSSDQPLFTTTLVFNNYSKCEFDWNKMIERHIKPEFAGSLKSKEEGLYGDKLLIFSAYNPISGNIEDFIVRCELLGADREDGEWAQNGQSISIVDYKLPPDGTDGFIYKPLNYGGLVFGYAKISLASTGPKTAINAFERIYLLDGVSTPIWIETYGKRSDFLNNYTKDDGFVTPQYFPNTLSVNPNAVEKSENNNETGEANVSWFDSIFNNCGFSMTMQDALLYFWSVKNWDTFGEYRASSAGTGLATEIKGKNWVEKIRLSKDISGNPYYVSFHTNSENDSLTDAEKVYSLLNPYGTIKGVTAPPDSSTNCSTSGNSRPLRAKFGGKPRGTPALYDPSEPCPQLFYGGFVCPCFPIAPLVDEWRYEDFKGLIYYQMGTINNFKFFASSLKPSLGDKVALPFLYQLWPRFKLYFLNLYVVEPVGTSSVIPGPSLIKIGKINLKKIGGFDAGINLPLWEAYYLTAGRIKGMEITISPNEQYFLRMPSWMGQACVKANTRHYASTDSKPFFQF